MATPLTRALLGAMYSEGQPSGFVFWFLELIALGCVLVAIEGRFAIGEVASGLRWLAAGLIVGVVGFYRPQINARIQSHRKHSPLASTAIVAILAALIAGSAWWFLVEGRTPPTAASPMFVTVENVRPFGNTFEKGKQPVFHPEFLNSGPVPLDGVRVNVTLQVLAALPTEPWPFDSSNDEKLPRLPANGGKRHVERIGNELTQAVVDALNRKTLHYYVFVRIYDDSEAKQHSDSCFVFNPDRGRTGTYTGDPDWVFDRCDKGIATVPASSGSGFSPEAIADGERHMREWRASRFKPPTRVEHVHRIITEPARRANSVIPPPPRAITGAEWQQLADRFKSIPDGGVRADWHKNSTGEGWRVCGGTWRDSAKDCESFCKLAGAMLLQSPHIVLSETARSQNNPVWRWLYYVKDVTSDFNLAIHGVEVNDKGEEVGPIYGGTIDGLAAVSARVCFECAAHEV